MDALGNKGAYEDKTELDWTGLDFAYAAYTYLSSRRLPLHHAS